MSVNGAALSYLLATLTTSTTGIKMFNRYDDVYSGEFFDSLLDQVKEHGYDLLCYLLGDGQ
jgi:hypothetical protein